jgi:phosphohistidine phosphatase
MEIYLIRHSEAVELNSDIVDDSFRYLSYNGRQKTVEVASKLKEINVYFDCILTSPVVRAVQTAEIISSIIGHKGEFMTAIELMGGNSFTRFMQLINRNSRFEKIACIGHAPDVNNYALGVIGHEGYKELKINFKNTSVCKVNYEITTQTGRFEWFLKSDTMEFVRG